MRLSGQSSAAHRLRRENRPLGWKPVCRPPRKVRPDSTRREPLREVSLCGAPPLPALSDKQKWNRDFDFKTAFGVVPCAPLRGRFVLRLLFGTKRRIDHADLQHPDPTEGRICAAGARRVPHLRLRPYRVQLYPHWQRTPADRVRYPAPLSGIPGQQGDLRFQHHRYRR